MSQTFGERMTAMEESIEALAQLVQVLMKAIMADVYKRLRANREFKMEIL